MNQRLDEASKSLAAAIKCDPSYAPAYFLLSLVESDRQNFPRAIELLSKLLEFDSHNADAYSKLGQILQKTGNEGKAIEMWKAALAIDPGRSEDIYHLMRALQTSDPVAAKAYREQFDLLTTQHEAVDRAKTLANLGIQSASEGDTRKAVSQLEEAISNCGGCQIEPDLHKTLGLICARACELSRGVSSLRLHFKSEPRMPRLSVHLRPFGMPKQ